MQALDGFQTSASAPPHRLSNRHQVQNSYDVGRLILLFFFFAAISQFKCFFLVEELRLFSGGQCHKLQL